MAMMQLNVVSIAVLVVATALGLPRAGADRLKQYCATVRH
jgi:hypothetical protein